jgi:hypothetical protein
MATAGHSSMATTKRYLHLAGVTFKDDAAALEERLLGARLDGSPAVSKTDGAPAVRSALGG